MASSHWTAYAIYAIRAGLVAGVVLAVVVRIREQRRWWRMKGR